MPALTCLCRTATTFGKNGELDEDALRQFLQRFVDAKLGVYLASAGSGEGHALKWEEIRRVYEIGVEVCKGKVQVNANPPEQNTARMAREHTLLAIAAGVDVVNVYGPASWHGFRPTELELMSYYDDVLRGISHPIAIAPNPVMGYTPSPAWIAAVTSKHTQVVSVNLSGVGTDYFIELKQRMTRSDVEIYVPFPDSFNMLQLGGTGLVSMEGNILPKTFRRYIDLYESGQYHEQSLIYADVNRFIRYTRPWHSSAPRWLKMAMRTLKIPGWEGGLREPYRMPSDEEVQIFADGLLRLGIPEIDEQAKAAGAL
jgi:4-hydroxy-tetrahydrodipicolinate synthase